MPDKIRGRILYITISIMLFMMLTVSPGCNIGYKLLTEDKEIAHFSFEYPADLNEVVRSSEDDFICISLIREVVKDGWWDKSLSFITQKPPVIGYEEAYDAGSFIEAYITRLKDSFEVVQVLERSSVNISGISGEQVIYTYDDFSRRMPLLDAPLEGEPAGPSLIWIDRAIFFDYNGLVWFIRMKSTEETSEQTKLDFEHLIETFRILE